MLRQKQHLLAAHHELSPLTRSFFHRANCDPNAVSLPQCFAPRLNGATARESRRQFFIYLCIGWHHLIVQFQYLCLLPDFLD